MAGCRVILSANGQYLINPTTSQQEGAKLDLIVAATDDAVMVEGEGAEASEEDVRCDLMAMMRLNSALKVQNKMVKKVGEKNCHLRFLRLTQISFQTSLISVLRTSIGVYLVPINMSVKIGIVRLKRQVLDALYAKDPSLEGREGEIIGYLERFIEVLSKLV